MKLEKLIPLVLNQKNCERKNRDKKLRFVIDVFGVISLMDRSTE